MKTISWLLRTELGGTLFIWLFQPVLSSLFSVSYTHLRDNNRRGGYRGDRNRDDRDGGRRDFKRKSKKNSRDFENHGNKRPHRTSSEKKNGFVIRNKGDK